MAQQGITFEWILEETRAEVWNGLVGSPAQRLGESADRLFGRLLVRGVALVVAALVAAGAAGLSPSEKERRHAETGIAFHLGLENQAWHTRDYAFMTSLLDPTVSDDWLRRWRDDWRRGADGDPDYRAHLLHVDLAGDGLYRATVVVEQSSLDWSQSSPFQEVRFYRRDGQAWLRTVPPADYWGRRAVVETDHLSFTFYEQDTAMVQAVAPRLQAAYVELHTLLGVLPPPAGGERLVISVVPRPTGRWAAGQNRVEVTSPAVLPVAVGDDAANVLANDVMGWFTYRVLRDYTPSSAGRYLHRWPLVVWGLRGWLRADLLASSSPWRSEAKQILRESDALPFAITNVTQLQGGSRPSREDVVVRYLAAESFIAYAMETYGRERLHELMGALMRYGDWNRIILEVYGVSSDDFVAGWNAFVLDSYWDTVR